MLILGGAARVLGPVVGAMIFWVLLSLTDNILNEAIDAGLHLRRRSSAPPRSARSASCSSASLLMLLMIFRPQGIFGDRREIALDAR